ncbi:MAG: DUF4340 domain-containing protein [Bacteroidota bacterium]
MKRQNGLILLFALAVLVYGLSQYLDQGRSPVFEAALLDFLPHEIEEISVASSGELPFRLLLRQGRWLLLADKVNEPADANAIRLLLDRLRSIRTDRVISDQPAHWSDYGVDQGEGTRICLRNYEKTAQCVQLSHLSVGAKTAYARLPDRPEVYAFAGDRLHFFTGKMDLFRFQALTNFSGPITQLRWTSPTDTLLARRDSSAWQFSPPDTLVRDSIAWLTYVEQLPRLEAPAAAANFDELALDSAWIWNLQLVTNDRSVQLRAFHDSLRTPTYLLHSSQFPQRWLAADSAFVAGLTWPWVATTLADVPD